MINLNRFYPYEHGILWLPVIPLPGVPWTMDIRPTYVKTAFSFGPISEIHTPHKDHPDYPSQVLKMAKMGYINYCEELGDKDPIQKAIDTFFIHHDILHHAWCMEQGMTESRVIRISAQNGPQDDDSGWEEICVHKIQADMMRRNLRPELKGKLREIDVLLRQIE